MSRAIEATDSQTHPELMQDLLIDIQEQGKIPFARFMEQALYHESCGYYMNLPHENEQGSSRPRIGWKGDYITTPYFHTFLAKALVRQLCEMDDLLDRPVEMTVVEMGAGEGLLARDILQVCATVAPDLADRLTYVLIERSPSMRRFQETHLFDQSKIRSRIRWVERLDDFEEESLTGLLFSNELVDAFPVHRIRIQEGCLKEVYVTYHDGRFVECVDDPSTPVLQTVINRWAPDLPDGYTTEINVEAITWMRQVAKLIKKGWVLTIDYGHTARDYFSPQRRAGTLVGYYRHQLETNMYERVGSQDMTAHVNFSSLAETGEASGLLCAGFTDLQHFLMSLGMEDMLAGCDQEGEEVQAAIQLLNPRGMGRTFKILVQQKGMPEPPALSGLKYTPFFHDVLETGKLSDSQRN